MAAFRCTCAVSSVKPPISAGLALALALATLACASEAPRAEPANSSARLRIEGTRFVAADGSTFEWRGITAFRLVDYVADGQEATTAKFLEWAASQRLTVVRVLTMMGGQFDLRPEDGRRALPRVLELAARHGIVVEVVALAGTADIKVDLGQHVAELGKILATHRNALLEIANEPVHPSQAPEVHKPEVLRGLAATVPSSVPIALGSIERGDGFGEAGYVTWHSPRESGSGGWGHVLALADGARLLARWKKPVVSDEPIGAGPALQPGRRDNVAARFRAAALLTRLVGMGATFHYEDGIQATIPAGAELACFNAWKEAWTLLPAGVEQSGVFRISGGAASVVANYDRKRLPGVYERIDGSKGWILAIGDESVPLTLADGWKATGSRSIDGARLITVTRAPA
jgi:hypothetical protein